MEWIVVSLGYLVGAFPTGYLSGRILRNRDIRQMGDTNPGAANVYRELGKWAGIAVFLIDCAKGAAAILIARGANVSQVFIMLSGVAAVVGHNWPVYIGFRGGRGLSTTIGVLIAFVPLPSLVLAPTGFGSLPVFKNTAISAALFFIPLPLVVWLFGYAWTVSVYCIGVACLVGISHYIKTRPRVVEEEA